MSALPRILIVGVVRDQAMTLLRHVGAIDQAMEDYPGRKWLVVESDSNDDTLARLDEAQTRFPGFRYVSLGRLRDRQPSRTARIAHCRNHYLHEIRTAAEYRDVDYIVVADLDGVSDGITRAAVASCFARNDWAVCTANQTGPYYDLYALRHDQWCQGDYWDQYLFARGLGLDENEAKEFSCYSKMITIPPTSHWIEVRSAFGGLAIYRSDCIRGTDAVYEGEDEDGNGTCEHVAFHEALVARGYKLFINPKLINAGYTQHSRVLIGWRRLGRHLAFGLKLVARRLLN